MGFSSYKPATRMKIMKLFLQFLRIAPYKDSASQTAVADMIEGDPSFPMKASKGSEMLHHLSHKGATPAMLKAFRTIWRLFDYLNFEESDESLDGFTYASDTDTHQPSNTKRRFIL